jgi:sulfur dioxygenase
VEIPIIFRQLYDHVSSTYSYLIASRQGGEVLLVEPVLEHTDRYAPLARELDLRLVLAVDTHIHADQITGLGQLREQAGCITAMGEMT